MGVTHRRRAGCALAYSHASIVVYPDVWFETDGAGSGFKLIEDVRCFETPDRYAILADLPYVKLNALRVAGQIPAPDRILETIRNHIALKYPGPIEFIPLLAPLRPFPRVSTGLVSLLSSPSEGVGGYCSQMVSQILRDLYGVSVGGPDDHVSPGKLRKRLLNAGASEVNCVQNAVPPTWKRSDNLQNIYNRLVTVTSKLRGYQYPEDRASFEKALGDTFKEEGIEEDPKKYEIRADRLRNVLTKPRFFRLHEFVWPGKYS